MDVRGLANRSLVIGAATNWVAFAAALAVAFFLAPYLVGALGDARYGVWCVVEGILAYFTLFDLGLAACLVRFVAKHSATGADEQLNRIVSSCLALFVIAAAAVLLVGGGVVVPLVGPVLAGKLGEEDDVTSFMLLMFANLALTLPLSVFPTILDGLQRFGVKSVVRLVFLLLRVGAIIWAMERHPGLLSLALVFTVTNLAEQAVMVWLCFRFLPGLRLSVRLVDRATLKDVKGYSVDAFLAMLAGRVTVQTGAIIVGGFVTVAAAAHYALAARLVELAKNLLRQVTTTLTPAVSQREATGDFVGVRRVLLTGTQAVLYLVLPIHLGLLVFGRPFFARWVGPGYAEVCFPVMAVLSAALSLGVAQSVASRILYGLGRLKLFARLALMEAAVNLALCLALVGPLGIRGVAIAVAVPNVLFCLFVIGYVCRTLNVSLGCYLACWRKPVCAAVVPAAVWLLLAPAEPTWGCIARDILLGLVFYVLAIGVLEFTPLVVGGRVFWTDGAIPGTGPLPVRPLSSRHGNWYRGLGWMSGWGGHSPRSR